MLTKTTQQFLALSATLTLGQCGIATLYLTSLSSSHTCVALKITEMLLSDCDPQRLQLIANSYLDMLHVMLESPHTDMQIMATDSVSRFLLHTHLYHMHPPHSHCSITHSTLTLLHTHSILTPHSLHTPYHHSLHSPHHHSLHSPHHHSLHTITHYTLHTITHSHHHSLHSPHHHSLHTTHIWLTVCGVCRAGRRRNTIPQTV